MPVTPADAAARARWLDRALGAYLGLALGDALGATVEFMTPREIAARHGTHREMIGAGWLKLAPGQVTDDTTMCLALGEGLLAADAAGHGIDDAEAAPAVTRQVAEAFLAWWRGRPVDCGNTCRRGIARYLREGSLHGLPSDGDAGNGALMRNLPVALATLGRPPTRDRLALAQARITHHHPLSDAATLAFGALVQALILNPEPEVALAEARALAQALVDAHREFRHAPYPGRASAYVVDTVQTVLHHFLAQPQDFEAAVVATVNCGEDADTTGALVGMLAGALGGTTALPPRWLARLDRGTRAAVIDQTHALLALASRSASAYAEAHPA